MRIATQLRFISTVSLVAVAVLTGSMIWLYNDYARERNDYRLANQIKITGLEGASYRDQYFLYRENRTRAQWDETYGELKRLLDLADQAFIAKEDKQLLELLRRNAEAGALIFQRITDNTEALTAKAGQHQILEEFDKRLSTQLLLKTSAFQNLASALEDGSAKRVEATFQHLISMSALFALMLALATLVTSNHLGRLIRKRLVLLHEGARRVAAGDLDYRIPLAGKDELAALGQSINAMTNEMQRFTRRLETEIRERAQTELALRESEHQLRRVINGSDQGFWDWNLLTKAFTVSARFETMLGYAPGEMDVSVENWHRYVEPEDLIKAKASIAGHLAGKSSSHELELRMRAKSGEWRWVLTRGRIVEWTADGCPAMMSGTHTDITARKQAETALRQREHTQRALLDNFPFMVWLKDPQSRFLAVNRAFASGFGYPSTESLIGKCDFDITAPDLAERYRADDRMVLATGVSLHVEEPIEVDGQRRVFETYKAPVTVDGCAIGLVGFARDITERKENEAAVMAAKAEAEKANRAKSRFLAAASHDLRQPLSALALYVGVLQQQTMPGAPALIGNIQSCVDSLSELLTDLLDVSKLEAGVVAPSCSNVAIDELLVNLVSVHASEAQLKGLRLRSRRAEALVHTDPILLRRILGNLIANAIRYTQRGGVLVGCRRHQGKLWVEVWDTGVGIPEDQTELIFEPFRKLGDDARNRGSGLGLAIVDKTAKLLGLAVRLRSRPGRGSMFAIELPLGRVATPAVTESPAPAARTLRIGLVEDNPAVLPALVLALESAAHEVVAAVTGRVLLERLGGNRPDIVISDYRLGDGETGLDVIEAARKAFGDDLPTLLITGDTGPALIRSMADRGVAVYYKPLRIEALLAAIRKVTDGKTPQARSAG